MALKTYEIYVDGIGFADTYIVKAKDLATAKRKAIAEFKSTLKAVKAT